MPDKKCCCHADPASAEAITDPGLCRSKMRDDSEKRMLLNRLARIEGQLRGIRRMVEEDAWCPDILTQSAAAGSALDAFSRELLSAHIRTCVVRDIREERNETVEELIDTIRKFMK